MPSARPAKAEKKERSYGFLKWVAIPCAVLVAAGFWYETGAACGPEDHVSLRAAVHQAVRVVADHARLREQYVRITAASQLALAFGLLTLLASVAVIYAAWSVVKSMAYARLAAIITAAVLGLAGILYHVASSCIGHWYFEWWFAPLGDLLPQHELLGRWLVVATNLAVGALIVAIAALYRPVDAPVDIGSFYSPIKIEEERRISRILSMRIGDLHKLLYVAATLFTVSVLAIFLHLYINVAGVLDASLRKPLFELASNMTFIYGITYTALLLAAFYPCLTELRHQAMNLKGREAPDKSSTEYFAIRDLEIAPYAALKEFMIALTPLIASTLPAALKTQ